MNVGGCHTPVRSQVAWKGGGSSPWTESQAAEMVVQVGRRTAAQGEATPRLMGGCQGHGPVKVPAGETGGSGQGLRRGTWADRWRGHRHRSRVVPCGRHPPQRRPDSQEQSGLAGRWLADRARGTGWKARGPQRGLPLHGCSPWSPDTTPPARGRPLISGRGWARVPGALTSHLVVEPRCHYSRGCRRLSH